MCLIGLKYLWGEWSNAEDPPMGYGTGNVKATIFFIFLLIGTWVNFDYSHNFKSIQIQLSRVLILSHLRTRIIKSIEIV